LPGEDQERLVDRVLFRPIDVERLAAQLRLEDKGEADGASEIPSSDQRVCDDPDSRIASEVSNIRTSVVQEVMARLKTINEAIARDQALLTANDLDARIAPEVVAIEQRVEIDLLDLDNTRVEQQEAARYFREWRRKRKLSRPARKPKGAVGFFADLFLIAILEGALNLFFFMENNALGILGAFFQAFLIAGANILICAVLGFTLLKRINSVFLLNKVLGFGAAAVLIVGLPTVHWVIGFYRIARQTSGEDASSALWTAITWANQYEYHRLDELSIVMMVIGVVAGGYAARKGYEFGDRYPDYSKHYWDAEERRLDFMDHLHEVTDEMLEQQKSASDSIERFIFDLGAAARSLNAYLDRKAELPVLLQQYEAHLADVARRLTDIYREANRKARTTPEPPCFARQFEFADPLFVGGEAAHEGLGAALRDRPGLRIEAKSAIDSAKAASSALQQRVAEAIRKTRDALRRGEELDDEKS